MSSGGFNASEKDAGTVEYRSGDNYDLASGDGLAGGPVAVLPFEGTPHNFKFCIGLAEQGLRVFGVLNHDVAYGAGTSKVAIRGKVHARVKAAATALPGAYLAPEWGSTHHFYVSAAPTPFRLVTDLSGESSGTIYGPDDVTSDGLVPFIVIGEGPIGSTLYWSGPAAADTDGVHAAVTDTGSPQTVTTGITNPDCPRCITATSGGTAADIGAVQVIITGTNILDEVISETLPIFTANSATTVTGSVAFKTVTSIYLPAHDGVAATTEIGWGDKLGFPDAAAVRLVEATILNGAVEGTAITLAKDADEVEKNTGDPNSAIAGTQIVVLLYER